jgi:hypothetical protein
LDITLTMNRRILTKYDKNIYLDLALIRESRTLGLLKPESLVLQSGAFSKCHNFLVRVLNHAFHISILIVLTRASSWRLQIFSLSSYSYSLKYFFVS